MFNPDHSLPIFVHPQEIVVVKSKLETYRQLLTIINPYEFVLHYKVLSNAPSKFKVNEPSGFIKPKCAVDIVVRHLSPNLSDSGDCLRVEVFKNDHSQKSQKDVKIIVTQNELRGPISDEFRSFPSTSTSSSRTSRSRTQPSFVVESPNHSQNLFWFAIIACCASIVIIMLPTYSDSQTKTLIPVYLHPSQNLQLVAAYCLGIITVYLMRQAN